MKLLDWIIGREPVATATGIAAVVTALAGLLTAFDVLELSAEQIAAIGAFAAAAAGWLGRSAVSPVKPPPAPEHGGVPLALLLLLAGAGLLLFFAFGACDALINDEEEENDLGWARVELASHDYEGDPCWDYGDCGGGYDERNGGSGDGRGGDGRFGGGRSGDYDGGPGDDCRNACGNTIIVPSPGGGREGR